MSAQLVLDKSLVPLPDDGKGLSRFGLPQRIHEGRYAEVRPRRSKPRPQVQERPDGPDVASRLAYLRSALAASQPPLHPVTVALTAHIVVYCPNCGKRQEIDASLMSQLPFGPPLVGD